MGNLDEPRFAAKIAACKKCDAKSFEVASYIDRQVSVMLGERSDDGRWTHDGDKLIDGVFRIKCMRCGDVAFTTADCPRCHRVGALSDALGHVTRLAVPKLCPSCKGTKLTVTGFAPSTVRTGVTSPARFPAPTPNAQYGDLGFHVAHVMCDCCDWVALAEGCPMCGGPGPLRSRPG